ncbi:transposase [Stenotrophomonas sp. ATCM1_4]|uniref:REP-associated tyrosine transposase n=1 Tax=Stenotrophomonas sp. ATCM1_4 TaxID=2259330 RepID=UPI0010453C46|nr:transposase [Stenotrophomonas sp. ATCM1_4]TDB27278.1 transposase [Stenotrophomonas sp. ATCM1_4]
MPLSPEQPPGHKALRRGRTTQIGQISLITFTTRDRIALFGQHALAAHVARAIHDPGNWPHARLMAWVLMPDHWHGLIAPNGLEPIGRTIARLKANTTRHLPATVERPVWARAFHDRALRREEDLRTVARYLLMNPVRAGLVSSPRFYPYWNAIWL